MKKRIIIRRRAKPAASASSTTRSRTVQTRPVQEEASGRFDPSILGLGDMGLPSKEIDAIAAVFDIAGFTRFCNQVDSHLAVPRFLGSFLNWLFDKIRRGLAEASSGDRKALWTDLPVMAKFQGDGVLFLWNTRDMNERLICRIVTTLYEICNAYSDEFFPRISTIVEKPPAVLRCGVARGKVFSVGNGKDYVGHCINTASRLQKLSLLTFCFPHRGFNVEGSMDTNYRQRFAQKSITIRGIGENELVWVVKDEFQRLPEKSRGLFRDP